MVKELSTMATMKKPDGGSLPSIGTSFSDMPYDVMINIFQRLPIKFIVFNAYGVCKPWISLILEPFFRRSIYPPVPSFIVCPNFNGEFRSTKVCTVRLSDSSYDDGTELTAATNSSLKFKISDTVEVPYFSLKLVGSCNGLVCLWNDTPILLLCNPKLGSHLVLPDPNQGQILGLGFGYNASNHQYKVVQISKGRKGWVCYVCRINGLKGRPGNNYSWERVHEGSIRKQVVPHAKERSVFLNGKIIWLDSNCENLIHFDVGKELFGKITFPPGIFQGQVSVGVFHDDECKCRFFISDRSLIDVNIWVMEDLKCVDSLDIKWKIQFTSSSRRKDKAPVRPIKVLEDGRLLIGLVNGEIACYDSETARLERIQDLAFSQSSEILVDVPNILGCLV